MKKSQSKDIAFFGSYIRKRKLLKRRDRCPQSTSPRSGGLTGEASLGARERATRASSPDTLALSSHHKTNFPGSVESPARAPASFVCIPVPPGPRSGADRAPGTRVHSGAARARSPLRGLLHTRRAGRPLLSAREALSKLVAGSPGDAAARGGGEGTRGKWPRPL